jgi:CBS domain containing-hemolysin-like protein
MQGACLSTASLIYAAAVIQAWSVLPGSPALKLQRTALFPGLFLGLTLLLALTAPPVRRYLVKHLWLSYRTGFGQTVISVLAGIGVLLAVAGFIFWTVYVGAHGGKYPGSAFSGYAAGIGLLMAQTLLVRGIERDPVLRAQIEERLP